MDLVQLSVAKIETETLALAVITHTKEKFEKKNVLEVR